MRKVSQEKLDECLDLYNKGELSIRKITGIVGLNRKTVSKYIKSKTGKESLRKAPPEIVSTYNKTKYVSDNPTKEYVLVDRKDESKVIRDVNNLSGSVSAYLRDTYGIAIPSNYQAKKQFKQTGEHWYEKYFYVRLVDVKEKQKRVPRGYWQVKENCMALASTCRSKKEVERKSVACYYSMKIHGWLDEAAERYFDPSYQYNTYDKPVHLIYVYEFEEQKVCYVGRTSCMNRRHLQHVKGYISHGEMTYDSIYRFCEENHIDNPEYKILESGLTAPGSQEREAYWLDKYVQDGWKALNEAPVGLNKSSLGATIKWTHDRCKEEAAKYRNRTELRKKNQSAYNSAYRNGWLDEFYPNMKKKPQQYWHSLENCLKAASQCRNVRELIRNFGGCYHSCIVHGFVRYLKFRSKVS